MLHLQRLIIRNTIFMSFCFNLKSYNMAFDWVYSIYSISIKQLVQNSFIAGI